MSSVDGVLLDDLGLASMLDLIAFSVEHDDELRLDPGFGLFAAATALRAGCCSPLCATATSSTQTPISRGSAAVAPWC